MRHIGYARGNDEGYAYKGRKSHRPNMPPEAQIFYPGTSAAIKLANDSVARPQTKTPANRPGF